MADSVTLFPKASAHFGELVRSVGTDQWGSPTPCTDWDVRALVNHLVYENVWAVPMVEGKTIEEVGDAFEGDLLGDDPKGRWEDAVAASAAAIAGPGVAARTVHTSFGDISGDEYLSQLVIDHTIHGWDLAHAIGADETIDPELVEFVFERLAPQAEQWRSAGVFAAKVEVAPGADRQTQLLALTGRAAQ